MERLNKQLALDKLQAGTSNNYCNLLVMIGRTKSVSKYISFIYLSQNRSHKVLHKLRNIKA